MPFTSIHDLLTNPVFAGGIGLGITGAAAALGRNIPGRLWDAFLRQCITTVDVVSGDPLFEWLKAWFDAHPTLRTGRRLSASVAVGNKYGSPNAPLVETRILFTPAPGDHFIRYRGRLVWISRERKEVNNTSGGNEWFRETFTIRALTRNQEVVRGLLSEARSFVDSEREKMVGVYVQQYGCDWNCVMRRRARSLDSVLLNGDEGEALYCKLRRFLDDEAWYRAMGIPYHVGCLFEGVPGSGKSSLAAALAGALGLDIYMLSLSARGMDDDTLRRLVANTPPRAMLLLEDIDGVFNQRERVDDKALVTFPGLLNVLDGVASHHGSIVVMSTNHVERLDPALLRRGRADHRLTFRHATTEQARRMFERFFPGCELLAARFASTIPDDTVSMADLQGFLLERRDDAERAVAEAEAGGLVPEVTQLRVGAA